MIKLNMLSLKLFKNNNYTIQELCKQLGIKTTRFDVEEVNYSRNETSQEKVRWILLFGKKSKNNGSLLLRKNFLINNNIYDYAVILDENMTICDIYEGYTIYNGNCISGRLETEYNGKKIVNSDLQSYVTKRFNIHQKGNERLSVMTKKILGSRY